MADRIVRMTTSVQKTKESIRRNEVTDALTTLAICVAKFDKIKRKDTWRA
jgi:hypothetical protein